MAYMLNSMLDDLKNNDKQNVIKAYTPLLKQFCDKYYITSEELDNNKYYVIDEFLSSNLE